LSKLGLIDRVIEEPLGGAHRNVDDMAANIKIALTETLAKLQKMDKDKLLKARYKRLMDYGEYK
jgi:acetyl-CoA carboxylase carboxyl transferase subunit alpha